MDGGWADAEVALQIGFGRRAAEYQSLTVDEGEILPLLWREAGFGTRKGETPDERH